MTTYIGWPGIPGGTEVSVGTKWRLSEVRPADIFPKMPAIRAPAAYASPESDDRVVASESDETSKARDGIVGIVDVEAQTHRREESSAFRAPEGGLAETKASAVGVGQTRPLSLLDEPRSIQDAEWVVRARNGDETAFSQLYRQYSRYVARLAYQCTGTESDVADVVQSVFMIVAQQLASLREPRLFRPWIRQITVREVQRRARVGRRSSLLSMTLGFLDIQRTPPIRGDEVLSVHQLLGRVPVEVRLPWILYEVHGHTHAEVAEACGVSIATVKRRIAQAVKVLQGATCRDE